MITKNNKLKTLFVTMFYLKNGQLKAKKIKGSKLFLRVNKRKFFSRNNTFSYTISTGSINEKGTSGASTSVSQNSPLSFGYQYLHSLAKNKFIAFSTNLNLINYRYKGSNKNSFEYGLGSHYRHHLSGGGTFFFGGVDLEQFPIINTDRLTSSSSKFELLVQRPLFLTLGAGQKFNLFNRDFMLRGSVSPTILALGESNSRNNKKYQGIKYMLGIMASLNADWSLELFYKKYSFSQAGTLDLTRYGLGVYYAF